MLENHKWKRKKFHLGLLKKLFYNYVYYICHSNEHEVKFHGDIGFHCGSMANHVEPILCLLPLCISFGKTIREAMTQYQLDYAPILLPKYTCDFIYSKGKSLTRHKLFINFHFYQFSNIFSSSVSYHSIFLIAPLQARKFLVL